MKKQKSKNPPKKITSKQDFKDFLNLLKNDKLPYKNLVQFGEHFSIENLLEAEDIYDLAAVFYIKGLIKGYSTSYHPSREYSRSIIHETFKELDDKILHLFKFAKIPPYRKVRL